MVIEISRKSDHKRNFPQALRTMWVDPEYGDDDYGDDDEMGAEVAQAGVGIDVVAGQGADVREERGNTVVDGGGKSEVMLSGDVVGDGALVGEMSAGVCLCVGMSSKSHERLRRKESDEMAQRMFLVIHSVSSAEVAKGADAEAEAPVEGRDVERAQRGGEANKEPAI